MSESARKIEKRASWLHPRTWCGWWALAILGWICVIEPRLGLAVIAAILSLIAAAVSDDRLNQYRRVRDRWRRVKNKTDGSQTSTYRYRDAEKRRAYMRDWMRRKRADE